MRQPHDRRQQEAVLDATPRRQRADGLVPLLPVRVAHQPGHLRLPHPARRGARRRRAQAACRDRPEAARDRRRRRGRDRAMAGRIAAPQGPAAADRPPPGQVPRAAAGEAKSGERLRAEGLALAEERLKVEEELRDADWRAEHYASAAERRRTRIAALDMLVSNWDGMELAERQQPLRELVDQVRVGQGEVQLVLRP